MSLSDRIRPNSEAAPWVIEEIKKLEAEAHRYQLERDAAFVISPSMWSLRSSLGGSQLGTEGPSMLQHWQRMATAR